MNQGLEKLGYGIRAVMRVGRAEYARVVCRATRRGRMRSATRGVTFIGK